MASRAFEFSESSVQRSGTVVKKLLLKSFSFCGSDPSLDRSPSLTGGPRPWIEQKRLDCSWAYCPYTNEVMMDPVVCKDGVSYEISVAKQRREDDVFLENYALAALIVQLDKGVFEEVPVCPITTEPFHDPVIIETGQTYERAAIEEWLGSKNTCPNTGLRVEHKIMIPNRNVQAAMLWIQSEQERARGF